MMREKKRKEILTIRVTFLQQCVKITKITLISSCV